ncbi:MULTISPECIES: DUF4435 domain-containing protein [unclassified Rhizobium]|uniref:DUF4435 domain-containing protein n=1 Tax=unclassified Rhizobium TaxID=2613769 RepID=UPI00288BA445|nr:MULTISPECIES: DUF4435 domain-containing protein [unclassified Rhizobium]
MSFAAVLLDHQDTPFAKLTELLQLEYKKYEHIIAVEGVDDVLFYHDFLEDLFGPSFLPIPCDNKEGVKNLKKACENHSWGTKPSIFYICDKDFDDIIGSKCDGIHYSQYYSIESEICTEKAIKYAINREVSPKPTTAKSSKITTDYLNGLKQSALHLKIASCLMIEARSRGLHPEFDSVSINDFFSQTEHGLIAREVDYIDILKKWDIPTEGFAESAKRWEEHLSDDEYLYWVRGKYLTQLAKKCLETALRENLVTSYQKCCGYLGREGMKIAKLALKEIPTLSLSASAHLQDIKL